MNNEDQTIRLEDGRILGYAQYGSSSGRPVFYFSGGNSSRLEGRWFDQAAKQQNVNLVVPDRPGFGLSDFLPGRTFLMWPNDVTRLADALEIEEFSAFGLSGGAPHLAALAYQIPERLKQVAIISGVAPPEMERRSGGMWPPIRLIFFLAKWMPAINRLLLKQMGAFYANEEQMLKRMKQALPEPDVRLIEERPEIITIFSAAAMEAHRNGIDGDAWEWRLYVRHWGFQLADVGKEIWLWYGKYDRNTPIGMGRYFAAHLPHNRLHIVEDGGHFSTINNHIQEILNYL